MIGVYKITNPSGAVYIGSSKHILKRFNQYKYLRHNEQCKIRNSIVKYGYENHSFEILEECDIDILLERERFFCLKYDVLNRINLNLKIPKLGSKQISYSQETLDKMSKIHKGKKISEYQKEMLIKSTKGKKQSVEHIEKRKMFGSKNPMFGKVGAFKGKKHTDEAKVKMSIPNRGKNLGLNGNSKYVIDTNTGIMYSSVKEVSILFNINYSTLKSYLNNSKLKNKTSFELIDNKNTLLNIN